MKELEEKLNRKLDYCPFCNHIIFSRKSKCPNCRKKLEEIYFQEIYCPHCKQLSHLDSGNCDKCGEKIIIPDFEYGKYIEIPKMRRINLVTEKEEEFYQQLKFEHFGKNSEEKYLYLKQRTKKDRRKFLSIILLSGMIYIIFVVLSLFTDIFIGKANPTTLAFKKFFISIWLWFTIKSVLVLGLYFLIQKKPLFSYIITLTIIIISFLFESLTFPGFPAVYIISQVITLILLSFGMKLTLNYEDFLTHFGSPYAEK
mgnify:CR=1 FL=1